LELVVCAAESEADRKVMAGLRILEEALAIEDDEVGEPDKHGTGLE
jgi:hypothetical protein